MIFYNQYRHYRLYQHIGPDINWFYRVTYLVSQNQYDIAHDGLIFETMIEIQYKLAAKESDLSTLVSKIEALSLFHVYSLLSSYQK